MMVGLCFNFLNLFAKRYIVENIKRIPKSLFFFTDYQNQLVYGNSEEGDVSSEVFSVFQSPEILQ